MLEGRGLACRRYDDVMSMITDLLVTYGVVGWMVTATIVHVYGTIRIGGLFIVPWNLNTMLCRIYYEFAGAVYIVVNFAERNVNSLVNYGEFRNGFELIPRL